MGTITVKDGSGASVTVAKLPDVGQQTKALSLPVALASDDSSLPLLTQINNTLILANPQLPAALGAQASTTSLGVGLSTQDAARLDLLAQPNSQLPAVTSGAPNVTITRPANVNPYSAYDVVGGPITIPTGLAAGQAGVILDASFILGITTTPAGMTTFGLHLYNITPPSAIADNGAFTLPSGDRASYLGYINLGTPNLFGTGSMFSQAVQPDIGKAFKLVSANLFAYLVTGSGYTPAANSEVYNLKFVFMGL